MKPDEIRIASLYLFRGRALVQALGRTVAGPWIPVGPLRTLPAEPLEGLLPALRESLEASCQGLPVPPDWAEVMAPLLEASGASKWPDFLKEATSLGLEQRGGGLSLVPTRNLGEEGGFEPLPAETVQPEGHDAAALAEALRTALARCG